MLTPREYALQWVKDTITLKDDSLAQTIAASSLEGVIKTAIEAALIEREAHVRAELTDDVVTRTAYHKGFAAGQAEEREKVKGLCDALLFYADCQSYEQSIGFEALVLTDEGDKARDALAAYKAKIGEV